MQFTELSYEMQLKVLDRFGDAMLKEQDEFLQFAMASAMVELEMWCNAPIPEPRKNPTEFKTNKLITPAPELLASIPSNDYIAQAFAKLEDD